MYVRQALGLMVFMFLMLSCPARDSSLVSRILQQVAGQRTVSDPSFTKGNFPSYISGRPSFHTRKKDDNVFFTALIQYTLRHYYPSLSQSQQLFADSVLYDPPLFYRHYRNKAGRLTYNFWRTDTTLKFPYTSWIHRVRKNTSLPDDMDDTVLSLMAQDADSNTAAEAHLVMQAFTNNNPDTRTIEKSYRQYPAYSVWYGKKFPPVFDVCVLSNVLSFVQHYRLTWTKADTAALGVIVQSIASQDFISKPLLISPYYGSTSLILYHLSRLMSYEPIPELEIYRTKLVTTALKEFSESHDWLEKRVLCSAIMKWGYTPPPLADSGFIDPVHLSANSNFVFFTGNIPSYFPPVLKRLFLRKKWLLFYHFCPAYNQVLLLEYLLLKQQIK